MLPLGLTLIYTTKYMSFLLWYSISIIFIFLCVLLLVMIKPMWTTMSLKNLVWLTWIQSIYWWQQVKYPVTYKHLQGINLIGIDVPWGNSYQHNWIYEDSSVMFIHQLLLIFLRVILIPLMNPMWAIIKLKNFWWLILS